MIRGVNVLRFARPVVLHFEHHMIIYRTAVDLAQSPSLPMQQFAQSPHLIQHSHEELMSIL